MQDELQSGEDGFFIKSDGTFYAHIGNLSIDEAILKAQNKGQTKVYPFKGTASTPDSDRDGEVLIQKGLDFAPFMESGEYNWNHLPGIIVGMPTGKKAWFEKGGWKSQGEIVSGMPVWPGYDTDMIIKQHNQLKKAGFNRGLCQSVEGKVTDRSDCGRYVKKASIYNIALTFRPINANCSIEMLAKSMRGEALMKSRDNFYDEINGIEKALSTSVAAPMIKEDLEGSGGIEKKLIRHTMKVKKCSEKIAKSIVYKFLGNNPQFLGV